MKLPFDNDDPRYMASVLYQALTEAELALHRIAHPECEAVFGSRDRVAVEAINRIEKIGEEAANG